jgi:phage tail sheath protein FI
MAEKIVSPGVFTNEKDLSFLPAGIAAIGAAIVGPTLKGPAFVPTVVSNFNDFINMFGGLSEETYVPYAVKSYLKNASTVTVVRILQEGGYNVNNVLAITYSSGSVQRIVGVALPSAKALQSNGLSLANSNITSSIGSFGSGSASGSFYLSVSGSGGSFTNFALSASFVPSSNISFDKVLGTNVKSNQNAFAYLWFSDFMAANNANPTALMQLSASTALNLSGSTFGPYRPARTPYVTSQLIAGQNPKALFRFFTLADGTDTNTQVKISIINQTLPTSSSIGNVYGTFTVLVRDYNDTDQRPVVLESFNNLDLDPNSANFIARRIGDRYNQINAVDNSVKVLGDYPNVSKYIRVDLDADVENGGTSFALYPKGHQSLTQPFAGVFSLPPATYVTQNLVINGIYNLKAYYGFDFSANDNKNYLKALPSASAAGANTLFNLDNCFFHPSASAVDSTSTGFTGGASLSGSTLRGLDVSNILKFSVPFQDGFNGDDPAVPKYVGANITSANTQGLDCTNANSLGSQAYIKALNIIQNSEQYDMNLLATPGITIANHSSVVAKAIDVAETRGDTFYIADPVIQNQTLGTAVAAVANAGIDSSYVGTYWPWIKIMDTDKNKPVWVPPSVVLPNIYAYNDNVAFEWFAPAGLNRGGIAEAVDVEAKLTFSQRDALYEARINPIATFPGQGICVWGQKTLQVRASALDRINVRRLLIALKKFIASSTRYLVFENNTTETRQRFLNIVNPYLERVKARQGLYAFRVVMDETNNTPDVIDRNQMYGQIFIQPAKTAEFIVLDFNILPTGASFENA